MEKRFSNITGAVVSLAILLTASVAGRAQSNNATPQKPPASLAGKYEGTAKSPQGEVAVKLELIDDGGKFSGRVTTPREVHPILKGTLADGTLALELESKGTPAKLTLKEKDGGLIGELSVDGQTGPVELHRVKVDDISGEWDGAADAEGRAFPFTLSLKVEGEKVTGSSSSELGTSSISSGIWKDGKLAIVLESGNGQIGLVATLQDGKLVGDYDFAGQMQGKWVAVRKK
jgi:hypothetical protein